MIHLICVQETVSLANIFNRLSVSVVKLSELCCMFFAS